MNVGFAVLDTGDVALLAIEFFGELLLCEVEFLATFTEHITIEREPTMPRRDCRS